MDAASDSGESWAEVPSGGQPHPATTPGLLLAPQSQPSPQELSQLRQGNFGPVFERLLAAAFEPELAAAQQQVEELRAAVAQVDTFTIPLHLCQQEQIQLLLGLVGLDEFQEPMGKLEMQVNVTHLLLLVAEQVITIVRAHQQVMEKMVHQAVAGIQVLLVLVEQGFQDKEIMVDLVTVLQAAAAVAQVAQVLRVLLGRVLQIQLLVLLLLMRLAVHLKSE